MLTILQQWKASCALLGPSSVANLLSKSIRIFIRATGEFMLYFGALLVLDALIWLAFGNLLMQALTTTPDQMRKIDGMTLLLLLVQSVLGLLAYAAFFLLLRKDGRSDPKEYFKEYFFKYVQLFFILQLIRVCMTIPLVMVGMRKLPVIPWQLMIPIKIFECLLVLYWLDATPKLRGIDRALERTANLFFYNLPVIIVAILGVIGINYGLFALLSKMQLDVYQSILLNDIPLRAATTQAITTGLMCKFLVIKYGIFFMYQCGCSILIMFYRRKKNVAYTAYLFE